MFCRTAICIFLLVFSPLFAKEELASLSCGCPAVDYSCDPDANKRVLPGPIAGVVTSMKCCPGLWSVSALALVMGGVAYALADSPVGGTVHTAHSN